MTPETQLAVLDGAAWHGTDTSRNVVVNFDEENNALTFHEGGALLFEWIAEKRESSDIADLFVALASLAWVTKDVLQKTAGVIREMLSAPPGHVTLEGELMLILRAHGNRWMTTAELAAEVNRRGRHWKAYRNRITAAKVLGRTRLYACTFERMGERVRLAAL
ncbi:MAG TPA: hypothetical protein VFX78_04365 [Candidatus Eisenbacteria bacterium]|nr:hypothetical protein [Candidatus Eisenbacteria bacterium]